MLWFFLLLSSLSEPPVQSHRPFHAPSPAQLKFKNNYSLIYQTYLSGGRPPELQFPLRDR